MNKAEEKGQILLIVVLIMVVALTVGLSLAARSITNLKIATDDENSQRAFSAAEAGVERLIKTDCDTTCPLSQEALGNNATFSGNATAIKGSSILVKGDVVIRQDEGVDIWLSNYSTDASVLYTGSQTGKVTLYWGDATGDCNNAALDIMVLSGSLFNSQYDHYVVDPCGARRAKNNFSVPIVGATVGSKTFTYGYSFTVTNGLLMRVVPLYANTTMAAAGGADNNGNIVVFPPQGKQIEATGQAGGTVRKITFVQSFPSIPAEFFEYTLISPK